MTDATVRYDRQQLDALEDSLAAGLSTRLDEVSRVLARSAELKASKYTRRELPYGVKTAPTSVASALYGDASALVAAVRAEDPAAIEVGVSALTQLDPVLAEEIALRALAIPPWPLLRTAALAALAKAPTERAFRALLRNVDAPRGGYFVRSSAYPGGCGQVVERLAEAPIMRVRPLVHASVADLGALGEAERAAFLAEVETANAALPQNEISEIEALLGYAAARRCSAARDAIVAVFRDHPAHNLRVAAGHALLALGDDVSLRALAAGLEGWEELTRWFAVKAVVQREQAAARIHLGDDALRLAEHAGRASAAFDVLVRNAREVTDPRTAWFRADPGWLDLALHWAAQKGETSDAADELLQLYSKAEIAAAKRRAKGAPAPSTKAAPLTLPTSADIDGALAAGDLPRAWTLIALLGEDASTTPFANSTEAVARETMRRVRRNLERIVARLREQGYVFRHQDRVLVDPLPDAEERLTHLEKLVGRMPIALRAAYEIIGACNLQGTHPAWPAVACVDVPGVPEDAPVWYTDPLVLVSLRATAESADDVGEGRPLNVLVCGDAETKAGFSGGTYEVRLPDRTADPVLDGAGTTLVGHLRLALAHGGFAGFAKLAERPEAMLRALTDGLEPI